MRIVWKCLQVRLRAKTVDIVGADWKMWRRSSLARSSICIVYFVFLFFLAMIGVFCVFLPFFLSDFLLCDGHSFLELFLATNMTTV